MVNKKTKKVTTKEPAKLKKQDDSKLFAFLAVFLSIIGFFIAIVTKKEDKYVMFYAKQSLVLFITYIILWVAAIIIGVVTLGLFDFIMQIVWVIFVVIWIIQIIYSLSGEQKLTPIIGKFADKFNF